MQVGTAVAATMLFYRSATLLLSLGFRNDGSETTAHCAQRVLMLGASGAFAPRGKASYTTDDAGGQVLEAGEWPAPYLWPGW